MIHGFWKRLIIMAKTLKLFCSHCGKETTFDILGQSRDFTDFKIKYVLRCQRCGIERFITEEKLKELLKET